MGSITRRPLLLLLSLACTGFWFKPATTHPHFGSGLSLPNVQTSPFDDQQGLGGSISLVHKDTMIIQPLNKRQDANSCQDGAACPNISPATTPFVNPPGLLQCQPRPFLEWRYRDAHRLRVKQASEFFCDHFTTWKVEDYATFTPIVKTVRVSSHASELWSIPLPGVMDDAEEWPPTDNSSFEPDIYDFRIELVKGCKPPPAPSDKDNEKKNKKKQKEAKEMQLLNLMKPLKHKNCKIILQHAWKHCNNAGRGGSLQAGCLRYSIHTKF